MNFTNFLTTPSFTELLLSKSVSELKSEIKNFGNIDCRCGCVTCIVHELEPKKMSIWLWWVEKYDELFESVAFDQKLRYFTDQHRPKGKMNFEYFQIQE